LILPNNEPPPRGKNKEKGYQSGAPRDPDESECLRSHLIKFHLQPMHVEKTVMMAVDETFLSIQQYLDR
jgi:hypothetical protein